MHQFDLPYMSHDKLYRKTYKYILTGINMVSRYKVARRLRTEKAADVAEMIKISTKQDLYAIPRPSKVITRLSASQM